MEKFKSRTTKPSARVRERTDVVGQKVRTLQYEAGSGAAEVRCTNLGCLSQSWNVKRTTGLEELGYSFVSYIPSWKTT